MTNVPPETCPWSLSGPQFPQPTAIQQRYCYPKGDPDYAGRKGGALWTMYGRDGKEDFEFRLLHVYFSAKRAINKGVALSEEDRLKQQLQAESANAAAASMAGTPKRTAKRVSRAVRSPWQERAENRAAGGKRKLCDEISSPRESSKWPRLSCSPMRNDRVALLGPTSPFQTRRMSMSDRVTGSIFVTPSTSASPSNQESQYGNQFDEVMFDHPPFHMVPSFEIEEHVKSEVETSKSLCPFRSKTGRPPMGFCLPSGGRALIEGGDSFAFNDADATELGGNVEDTWNDPLLQLSGKGSFDDLEQKKRPLVHPPAGGPGSSAESLKSRLGHVHERIRAGILAHPAAEQGPLLSIVATWARAMAVSPLAPTIQRHEGSMMIPNRIKDEQDISSFPTAV